MNPSRAFRSLGLISFAALNCISASAKELDSNGRFFVGTGGGLSHVDQGVGNGMTYGAQGTYFFDPNLGGGVFIQLNHHTRDVNSRFVGLQGLCKFSNETSGLWVGTTLAHGGFWTDAQKGKTNLAYGVKAGLDYELGAVRKKERGHSVSMTLGLEMQMSWTKPGTTYLGMAAPGATLKAWF